MAEKSAANLVDEHRARAARRRSARFIYALGIRHVGETTAKDLARHFGALERLLKAGEPQLLEVPDVGPIVAQSIHAFFAQPHNRDVVDGLRAAGIEWPETTAAATTARSRCSARPWC